MKADQLSWLILFMSCRHIESLYQLQISQYSITCQSH